MLCDIRLRRSKSPIIAFASVQKLIPFFALAGFQIFSVSPTAGPTTGGTIVTLSGEDLSDATGCKFGTAVVAVISYVGAGSPAAASGIVCQAPSQGSAANVISVSAVIDGDVTTNSLPWIFYGQYFSQPHNAHQHHIFFRATASFVAVPILWSDIGGCSDHDRLRFLAI